MEGKKRSERFLRRGIISKNNKTDDAKRDHQA